MWFLSLQEFPPLSVLVRSCCHSVLLQPLGSSSELPPQEKQRARTLLPHCDMNRVLKTALVLSVVFMPLLADAQQAWTLDDIIHRAKTQSRSSKWAETRKETRYWQYRSFRTNYNPQLRLEGNVPVYYKSVNQVRQQDGTYRY